MKNKILPLILINFLFYSCESPDASFRNNNLRDRSYSHIEKIIEKKTKNTKRNNRNIKKNIIIEEEMGDEIDIIPNKSGYSGYYKIGKPYQIYGITYIPQKYNDLEEVGEASWYGEKFDGKLTANGEIYDMNTLTAAHRTMPLPSIAEVTNLDNGKSIKVRINDRGPFANDRILDLSKRSAKMLGFQEKGIVTVRVKYLAEETEELLKELGLK